MKDLAAKHYNLRRGNCAQSVALAWKSKKDPSSDHEQTFKASGGGRAPEGLCGALHAARELAGDPVKETVQARFKERARGFVTCRDIRKNKALPCADCVASAAEILDELTRDISS